MSTEHDHRLREEFFERSVDLFCTATLEGRLLDFNPAWETLLGLGPSELRQANIRDLIHPEDYQETVDKILLMRGGQDAVVIEVRMVALDGSLHWVTWHAALASDRKSFQAIGREVTRHRVLYDVARAIPTLSTPEGMAERMLSETPLLAPAAWTSIALFGEAENEVVALEVWACPAGPGPGCR